MEKILFDVWSTLGITDYFKKSIPSGVQVNLGELVWCVESQVKASQSSGGCEIGAAALSSECLQLPEDL